MSESPLANPIVVAPAPARAAEPGYPSAIYAWFVMGALVVTSLVSFVDRQIVAIVVEPMKSDLGASDSEIGWLYGIFAVFYALAGLPIAYLADRKRRTWIIAVGVFIWSVMTILCGVARSFWQVLIARIGVGIAEATVTPSTMSLVGDYFRRDTIPLALAVYQTGAIMGSGLAFIIGGVVLGLVQGAEPLVLPWVGELKPWQQTFVYVGAPGLLLAALLLMLREPVRRHPVVDRISSADIKQSVQALLQHYRRHARTLFFHHFGFVCFGLLGFAFVFWTVSFFTRVHGMEASTTSQIFGWIFLIAGPLGSVWAGFQTRYLAQRGYADASIIVGLAGGVLAVLFILLVQLAPNATIAFVLYVPAMFFINSPFGIANGALPLMTPPALRAQAGAMYMMVNALAMLLGPPIAGMFNESVFPQAEGVRYSLAAVSILFGGLGTILLLLARGPYRKSLREAEAAGI